MKGFEIFDPVEWYFSCFYVSCMRVLFMYKCNLCETNRYKVKRHSYGPCLSNISIVNIFTTHKNTSYVMNRTRRILFRFSSLSNASNLSLSPSPLNECTSFFEKTLPFFTLKFILICHFVRTHEIGLKWAAFH